VGERFLEFVGAYRVKGERLTFPKEEINSLKNLRCKGVKGFVVHSFEAL